VLERVTLRGRRGDAGVQGEAGAFGDLRPRRVRLGRQRLQREHLLTLARPRCNPVGDRRPEQGVDRRLLAGIEGEIRIVDVVRDEPGALERAADPLGDPLHQLLERIGARGRDRDEHETSLTVPTISAVQHQQVKVHIEIERTASR
jgi:hypothetical protein